MVVSVYYSQWPAPVLTKYTSNGDYVYQFYEGGVRPLNDGTAKNNFKLNDYLGRSTVALTCYKDCVGFIPNSSWCNSNCPRSKRYIEPRKSAFSIRRTASFALQGRAKKTTTAICKVDLTFPDYPSTSLDSPTGEKEKSAGTEPDIIKNGWWDFVDGPSPTGHPSMCYRTLRRTSTRTTGKKYATEHIYELHIWKMFLNWLPFNSRDEAGGFEAGSVATCDTVKSVFTKKSTDSTSVFNTITPVDKLADEMTCSGAGCPADNRKGEFFILDQNVNAMEAIVLGEMTEKAEFKDLRCEKDWRSNKAKLATLCRLPIHPDGRGSEGFCQGQRTHA
jgi:hypothetical protein